EFRVQFVPPIVFLSTIAAIFFFWKDYVSPPTLVGQVEPLVTEVTSRDTGVLTNLYVERFQEVRAGELLAAIRVTDNRRYDAELQLLRSQVALSQLELGTIVDRQRLALDYEGLRVDYMRQQVELQMAKAQLPHAQFDVDLSRRLLGEKVVSEFEYHYFLSAFDSLNAQATQLTKNLEELERKLEAARDLNQVTAEDHGAKLLAERLTALQEQQRTLESLGNTPLLIEAPISGVITEVLRRPGENVMAGDPILTISSKQSDRIVGYLRAPLALQPKPGMIVQIRARNASRTQADARISGVGAGFQIITNQALLRLSGVVEMGLPVAITIPDALKDQLLPGELADITIQQP
ncbi:MAG TPA: HlyD family efflux transporter periplasmic adaptor subunit, partial [Verrucomicrobiae bacterium]|nr:HlyD family efflux transporter periplasmic adaptor subunit [Verrucomicrobiae bacterium]